ncbi:E3 ubiquitin-protein ligase HRD1-like [Anopheles ziemanni]|uniref:E3 ubiquitin-protein ligase HRD1-like n=1 Tax=Anopheles coustani TaxID=139045 RepID=UPI00265988B3|nr:E3 ubiquitin-protein ligase HRD1-like [Anopheles coustani]XP_058171296.1 E3 ubiquitin-protein ligase HRD1-like [Anopheles ziemanni]
MRTLGLSVISMLLTGLVIGNAYYQKKQFYPSVVYITKSNPSMAVIYIQSLVLVLMLGKLMKKIFLGTLRAAEFEHLMERFWYALTETCLAFTVFRDDFNPKFVALFTVLLFLKSFHWLAEDRVDYMERSPVIGWLFHVRVAGLLLCLGLFDYELISYAYQSTISKGVTVQLVFGFEYAILMTMVINTAIKYIFHAAELRSDTPWENKAVFLLYTELIIGFTRVVLYVVFVILMVKIFTLPMFAFRPMYYTMRNFKKALNDVILSRRAIRNMNTLYPDATPEELQMSDNICIICREDMVSNSKKLPCGHIFHTACLRSWFQRQQTCPTCRLNILRTPITAATTAANPAPNNNTNDGSNGAAGAVTDASRPTTGVAGAGGAAGANATGSPLPNGMAPSATNALPLFPGAPLMLPPFPFVGMPPYTMPLPPVPPSLDTLTDEEVRAMEGTERRHIEERIKHLRNIRTLLDASVALMNQYAAITARLPPEAVSHLQAPPPPSLPGQPSTVIPSTTTVPLTAVPMVPGEPSPSTSAAILNTGTAVVDPTPAAMNVADGTTTPGSPKRASNDGSNKSSNLISDSNSSIVTNASSGKATSLAKLEDLGPISSDEDDATVKLKKEPLPSTSKAFLITPDQLLDGDSSTEGAISSSTITTATTRPSTVNGTGGLSVNRPESSAMSELRRRRLEKFATQPSSAGSDSQ